LKRRGFTLIELLVVIVIIGILVAIALPNFIKIKDKAKEAEVKQNLHAIQLAVERYATDRDGNYPFYLYGGDSLFNYGTVGYQGWSDSPSRSGGIRLDPMWHPFDLMNQDTDTWDYEGSPTCAPTWGMLVGQPDDLESGFGDTLSFEGYMPKYPKNPFQQGHNGKKFSVEAFNSNFSAWGAFGGREGKLMFNIGWWGEVPEMMFFTSGDMEDTDMLIQNMAPGSFYYHPRWSDGVTNRGHCVYQETYNPGSVMPGPPLRPDLDDQDDVHSIDVAGYDLFALGSQRTKGQDLDTFIPYSGTNDHTWRTGYSTLAQERNPWITTGGDYDNVGDYDERPYSDGFPDFYIIHLGAGMDKKIGAGNVLE